MKRRDVMALGIAATRAGVSTPDELQLLVAKGIIYEARLQLLDDITREDPVDVDSVRIVVRQAIKTARIGKL